MPKIGVFIDNSNVFRSLVNMKSNDPEWECLYDPLKLSRKIAGNRELVNISFHCTNPPAYLMKSDEDGGNEEARFKHRRAKQYYSAIEKMDLMEVKYGSLKFDSDGVPREKGLDTALSIAMSNGAVFDEYDVAVLVANDGDYLPAIEIVKKLGKKVELVYFKNGLSMNLKKLADVSRRARRSWFERIELT